MQALIFDCDGVIADSERDGHRVAFDRAFAARRGLALEWSVDRHGVLPGPAGGRESPGFRAIEAWWTGLYEDHSGCPIRYIDADHPTKSRS